MRTLLIGLALLATIQVPSAMARGGVDFDLETKADLAVEARGAAGYRYAWDWGDGEATAGVRASHQYRAPGVYRVVVTATDDAGREWQRVREVEVRAAAPRAAEIDVDVDRDEVVASVDVRSSARVAWDWGDGHTSRGRRASHHYDEAGVYTVEVTVTERDGSCWTERRVVRVEGDVARERHADARASGALVSARVSLGGWEDDEEEERDHEARAYADSDVRISSYDRHDAPGPAAPLVALAAAGVALMRRFTRRP